MNNVEEMINRVAWGESASSVISEVRTKKTGRSRKAPAKITKRKLVQLMKKADIDSIIFFHMRGKHKFAGTEYQKRDEENWSMRTAARVKRSVEYVVAHEIDAADYVELTTPDKKTTRFDL